MTLTKTVSIDDAALPIIAEMEWTEEGTTVLGKLTCGQLDRSMYEAVNRALTALGGKWNRSKAAHVFKTDPRPQIVELLDTGALVVERDGYFPTPHEIGVKMALMADLPAGCVVLEPSAGTGELAEAILEVQPTAQVICGERNPRRVDVLKRKGLDARAWDFMEHIIKVSRIIQNPPFENLQDAAHVIHAFNCLTPGGVLVSVTSESSWFRSDGLACQFRHLLSKHTHEVVDLEPGAFKSSGTGVKTRIVKITKEVQ